MYMGPTALCALISTNQVECFAQVRKEAAELKWILWGSNSQPCAPAPLTARPRIPLKTWISHLIHVFGTHPWRPLPLAIWKALVSEVCQNSCYLNYLDLLEMATTLTCSRAFLVEENQMTFHFDLQGGIKVEEKIVESWYIKVWSSIIYIRRWWKCKKKQKTLNVATLANKFCWTSLVNTWPQHMDNGLAYLKTICF